MKTHPLITLTPQVEVFVDPYGYSVGWIKAIHNAAHELFRSSEQDECETYTAYECGGVGVRFRTDADYAQVVAAKLGRLLNLGKSTYQPDCLYTI